MIELFRNIHYRNKILQSKIKCPYVDLSHRISVKIEELSAIDNAFREIVVKTQPWFADFKFYGDHYYSDDFIEYALNDFGYRNRAKIKSQSIIYNSHNIYFDAI